MSKEIHENAAFAVQHLRDKQLLLNDSKDSNNFRLHDEYQAFLGNFQVSLGIVCSPIQLRLVHQLRENVYRDDLSYLLNSGNRLNAAADILDNSSYIFYCRLNDRIIASCRFTPSFNGEWESQKITLFSTQIPASQSHMLQIGRLLVTPEYRSQTLSEIIILASCHWLSQNTKYKSCYAICNPALVRFYRHFGAKSVAGAEIRIPERQNKKYRLVYGNLETAIQTLRKYLMDKGWRLNYPSKNNLDKTSPNI